MNVDINSVSWIWWTWGESRALVQLARGALEWALEFALSSDRAPRRMTWRFFHRDRKTENSSAHSSQKSWHAAEEVISQIRNRGRKVLRLVRSYFQLWSYHNLCANFFRESVIRTRQARGGLKLTHTLRFPLTTPTIPPHGSQTRRAALSRLALQFHFFECVCVFFSMEKQARGGGKFLSNLVYSLLWYSPRRF